MRPDIRPRVFLDSNVIFSGLYSSSGAPASILNNYVEGKLRLVVSQQVLEEVVRTINRKLPSALTSLRKLLVSAPPEIVGDPSSEDISRWAEILGTEDASVLAAAIMAQPDYLITGDKRFFDNPDIAKKSGLRVVTPAQFLKLWK